MWSQLSFCSKTIRTSITFDMSSKTHLVAREEVLVAILEDVELRIVQFGVVVEGAVPLPYKTAHSWAALRRELTMEDHDDTSVRPGWDNGFPEQEVLHLVLLVQVQGSLMEGRQDREKDKRLRPSVTG